MDPPRPLRLMRLAQGEKNWKFLRGNILLADDIAVPKQTKNVLNFLSMALMVPVLNVPEEWKFSERHPVPLLRPYLTYLELPVLSYTAMVRYMSHEQISALPYPDAAVPYEGEDHQALNNGWLLYKVMSGGAGVYAIDTAEMRNICPFATCMWDICSQSPGLAGVRSVHVSSIDESLPGTTTVDFACKLPPSNGLRSVNPSNGDLFIFAATRVRSISQFPGVSSGLVKADRLPFEIDNLSGLCLIFKPTLEAFASYIQKHVYMEENRIVPSIVFDMHCLFLYGILYDGVSCSLYAFIPHNSKDKSGEHRWRFLCYEVGCWIGIFAKWNEIQRVSLAIALLRVKRHNRDLLTFLETCQLD